MSRQRDILMLALTDISLDGDCTHCDPISVSEGVQFYANARQKRSLIKQGKAKEVQSQPETKSTQATETPVSIPSGNKAVMPSEALTVKAEETQEEKPKANKRRRVKVENKEETQEDN